MIWIKKGPHEFKTFVMNRLGEIREASSVKEWEWVSTKENPADDATRSAPDALKWQSLVIRSIFLVFARIKLAKVKKC